MTRLTLERYQVWIYVTALAIGAILGLSAPGLSPGLEALIWLVILLNFGGIDVLTDNVALDYPAPVTRLTVELLPVNDQMVA